MELGLTYLYSILLPCYCQAERILEEGGELSSVKIQNPKKLISGNIIEKRYEADQNGITHIETVLHCDDCLKGRIFK